MVKMERRPPATKTVRTKAQITQPQRIDGFREKGSPGMWFEGEELGRATGLFPFPERWEDGLFMKRNALGCALSGSSLGQPKRQNSRSLRSGDEDVPGP